MVPESQRKICITHNNRLQREYKQVARVSFFFFPFAIEASYATCAVAGRIAEKRVYAPVRVVAGVEWVAVDPLRFRLACTSLDIAILLVRLFRAPLRPPQGVKAVVVWSATGLRRTYYRPTNPVRLQTKFWAHLVPTKGTLLRPSHATDAQDRI